MVQESGLFGPQSGQLGLLTNLDPFDELRIWYAENLVEGMSTM